MANASVKDISHIVKFDGTNFPSWKYGIWMFLEKHKLITIVDGTDVKPEKVIEEEVVKNTAQIEKWNQRDVDARIYLYSTIKAEQQAALHGCYTASEMWGKIQTEYADNIAENEHLLMAKFFAYKFRPGQSIMSFIATIEQMASQLKDLGAPVSNLQIMAKIIMSLPADYRHLVSEWDSVPVQEKTISLLTARLIKEKKICKMYDETKATSSQARDTAYLGPHKVDKNKWSHSQRPYGIRSHRGRGGYRGRRDHSARGGNSN